MTASRTAMNTGIQIVVGVEAVELDRSLDPVKRPFTGATETEPFAVVGDMVVPGEPVIIRGIDVEILGVGSIGARGTSSLGRVAVAELMGTAVADEVTGIAGTAEAGLSVEVVGSTVPASVGGSFGARETSTLSLGRVAVAEGSGSAVAVGVAGIAVEEAGALVTAVGLEVAGTEEVTGGFVVIVPLYGVGLGVVLLTLLGAAVGTPIPSDGRAVGTEVEFGSGRRGVDVEGAGEGKLVNAGSVTSLEIPHGSIAVPERFCSLGNGDGQSYPNPMPAERVTNV
jgi:hypothetical protein